MKDYYGVLDVPVTATQEQIKSQYRQLVRVYHPDRFANPIDKVYAEEKLKEINEAYRAISSTTAPQTYETGATEGPPRPVIDPLWIDFGMLNMAEKTMRTVQVNNLGGPYRQINFIYGDHNPWFQIGNGRPLVEDKPMPVVFDITTDVRKLEPVQAHHAWVEIDMDGVRARLNLTVRVAKAPSIFKLSTRLAIGLAICLIVLAAFFVFQFGAGLPVISNALHSVDDASFAKRLQVDHLLFSVAENDLQMVYFAQADGENQQGLGIMGWFPAVAPNGRQIAYLSGEKETPQLFVSDVDGRHLRQVTSDTELKSLPIWSPDGRMIAFTVGPEDQAILRIFDIQANQFYDLPNTNLGAVKHFDWSPDSHTLLFDAHQGNSSKIYQANPTGQSIQLFTTFDSWDPNWSPDGKSVVVASAQGVYTLNNQGRDLHQLNAAKAWLPAWSFDGSEIAYLSEQSSKPGTPDLWVMDANGSNPTRITESGSQHFAWSPNSKRLAYITGNAQSVEPILYLWVTDLTRQAQLVAEVNKAYIAWTR